LSIHVLLNCVGDPIPMLMEAGFAAEDVIVTPNATHLATADLHRLVRGSTAILAPLTIKVDGDLLDAAGASLEVVANYAVGVDNIDLKACAARGVTVCNGPPPMIEPTADIAWALLIATARRLREGIRLAESGDWKGYDAQLLLGHRLHGGTLLVVGAGRIGAAVARRSIGWDMQVLYTARSPKPSLEAPPISATRVTLEDGLPLADAVVLTISLEPSTRHLIDAAALALMKPNSVLVNVSRGPVVDEAALADALAEKRILGAGLDVHEYEPTIQPRLLECPNVTVLPHIGSATVEDRLDLTRLSVENISAVLAGRKPPHEVTPPASSPL
jgi:glyoxylate reductase